MNLYHSLLNKVNMKMNKLSIICGLVSLIFLLVNYHLQETIAVNIGNIIEFPEKVTQFGKSERVSTKAELDANEPLPRIFFKKTIHDFNDIGLNTINTCEFKFKNIGDATLKIKKIKPTCGCTIPSLSKKQYEPGEEGVIKVKYSRSNLGSVTRYILVKTNDPEKPKVRLGIKARVLPHVDVIPKKLRLLLRKKNAGAPNVTISSRDGVPFSINEHFMSQGVIKLAFDPSVVADKFILKPKVNMKELEKYPTGNVRIFLTHPKCNSITFSYQVVAKFQVQPNRLLLHNVEPNKPLTRELLIKNTDKEQFEVDSVLSKQGYIKVISQDSNDDSVRLKLQIMPPPQKTEKRYFIDSLHVKIKNDEDLIVDCCGFYR